MPTILTTGFFDQLNAAQVRFLKKASELGELHVGIGSDENHLRLKACHPIMSLDDRLFMVGSLSFVSSAFPTSGSGTLDFEADLDALKPDILVAPSSGNSSEKKALCEERGIEFKLLSDGSSDGASNRETLYFPYRVCLTGGWLDQPWVSEICPGAVTTLNIEPTRDFSFRSGMATSTRKTAKRIWSTFPSGAPENIAQILFGAENPPGKSPISGSQDALGVCLPGFNALHYNGGFWPERIESNTSAAVANWFESVLYMVPIEPRPDNYDPLEEQHLDEKYIVRLAESSELAISAVKEQNPEKLGKALRMTLESWRLFMPNTVPEYVYEEVVAFDGKCYGNSLSGCGGGYVLVIADTCPEGGFPIKVRLHSSSL